MAVALLGVDKLHEIVNWFNSIVNKRLEIKDKILGTTGFTSALAGKCVTNGRLDLANTLKNESEKENGSEVILPYYGSGGVMDMTISGDKLFATVWGMGLIELPENKIEKIKLVKLFA